ncbi:MAG: class III poly(R)-hydroxyalkanoic acid synthase subunit PhaC [Planctomycetes bacterium]|nr:class III poly(R)-hydroxyalkanoic acid synthase subunit PhaC [Planctomycetota bacterium]
MTETWAKMNETAAKFALEMEKIQKRVQHGMDVLTGAGEIKISETPFEVVYAEDKLKLLHYKPEGKETLPVPVLVVYALVNRQTMLDLQPDRSMIRGLLGAGFDVYMIEWGYPSRLDRFLTIEDYVNGYVEHCLEHVRKATGAAKVNLVGICQGGTFSAMYSALHPEKIQNLVTIVTPIHFETDTGLLNVWARDMDIDNIVDTLGNAPGDFMNVGFLLLNPFRLMFAKYVEFIENVDDPNFVVNFLRMEKWIFDSPDQAGECLRQFVKDLYQKNLLAKGQFTLGGKLVDLKNITMPVLNIYGKWDHLVPPASSEPFLRLVGSTDKEDVVFPTGHIGIFVSSKASEQLFPKLTKWLAERSKTVERKAETKKTAPAKKK